MELYIIIACMLLVYPKLFEKVDWGKKVPCPVTVSEER